MNTVLTIAGAHSGNEIATLMDDQNALHTAKVNELLNMDKFGVVELVDTLGIKTENGRIIQSETCGTRTNGQFAFFLQEHQSSRLHEDSSRSL